MNFCFTLLPLVLSAHGGTRNISTLSAVSSEIGDSLIVFILRYKSGPESRDLIASALSFKCEGV